MASERQPSRLGTGTCRPIMLALAFLLPAASGCEDEGPPPVSRRRSTVEALSPAVREAAKKAVPDITLEEVWENLDRDRKVQSYEVRGRNDRGKIREARISLDGKVLEVE